MGDPHIDRVLDLFTLNAEQRTAVLERGRDVVVTAGAGSGKTSTLVARYVSLLAEGVPPRRMAAVTFSIKAAREMRSRARVVLMKLQQESAREEDRQRWVELSAQLDSARIGTIHSLCAEILRAHPAEAAVDPLFEVLDEGIAAALRIEALEDTLRAMVEQEDFLPLLREISINSLRIVLDTLMKRRLDAREVFAVTLDYRARLVKELAQRMRTPAIAELIGELRGMTDQQIERSAGPKLALMVQDLLALWSEAESALARGDPFTAAVHLFQARREKMKGNLGSGGPVKDAVKELKGAFDTLLNPLTGGKESKDPPPDPQAEARFDQLLPLLRRGFELAHQAYQQKLESRQALDFDDLEYKAQQLLRREEIRARWQNELEAVLVDEFQDTNQRQRQIVEALAGSAGRLFIVGDMRQSIYRFRRADVTVFRAVQAHIRRQGGLLIDLERTYRAHAPLLDALGVLLAGVIGTQEDPLRPYYIPYTPLVADQLLPPTGIEAPHVEFVLGSGENTESARPRAAHALAHRLLELRRSGQINKWDDVALLFRASIAFPAYEEALEDAGIPFVTVAGRGFYDRPEIRDLVNMLRALADPLDDLSFAGLLRSPAVGLSDAALLHLRHDKKPLFTALQGDLTGLNERDRRCAERARQMVEQLLPLVDRVPVAELLKHVVDALDYRAVLATADLKSSAHTASRAGGRLWRNLDKLLEDAQVSQQVNVRSYLQLLETLNDAGAREGEAASESQGAVQLMTIHKSKGLEFPVVVLANAGSSPRASGEQVYLSDELGVTFKLNPAPMLYRLARTVDKDQDEAEELRVLYVALTRAKSKLIISAHATEKNGRLNLCAWAKDLADSAGLDLDEVVGAHGQPLINTVNGGGSVRVWCPPTAWELPAGEPLESQEAGAAEGELPPIYAPVAGFGQAEREDLAERQTERQLWRSAQAEGHVPGEVLGRLVHRALQRWLFPGDENLTALLDAAALTAGLASAQQRANAVSRAVELLARLRRHPLWAEVESAAQRFHELPYTWPAGQKSPYRIIDLLYQVEAGWQILDFKSDPIHTPEQRGELVRKYAGQVREYRAAVKDMLGVEAHARLCFLDDHGRVSLQEV